MPQFQIKDSYTGQTMTVEGDKPPSPDDAKELFQSIGPQLKPEQSTWDKVKDDLTKPPSLGELASSGPAFPVGRLMRDVVKPHLPGLFDESGTTLNPDQPRGLIPGASKALGPESLDKVLPEKEVSKEDSVPAALAKEGYNLAIGIPKFLGSPLGVATAAGGEVAGMSGEAKAMEQFAGSSEEAVSHLAQIARNAAMKKYGQAVTQYFSADMAQGAAQGAVDLYHNHKQMTWGQTAAALEGTVGSTLFGAWLGKKGFSTGEKNRTPPPATPGADTAQPAPTEPPASTAQPAAPTEPTDEEISTRLQEINDIRKSGGLAGQTREEKRLLKMQADRTQKTWDAEGASLNDAKARHEALQEELHSMQEGGLPDTDIEKTKQQIKDLQDKWGDKLVPPELSPEAKSHLAEHGKGLNIVTDDQTGDPNAPFAKGQGLRGSPAWATPDGKIVIHRRNFQDWFNSITPARRGQAVKSLLSEESIHTMTDMDDAAKYWKQMTGLEKWAMKYRYDRDGSTTGEYTEAHWGAESIRYHLQQMMRMTPTEIAQEYGGKGATGRRLKIQAVDILDGIVRKARQKLSSDKTSQAILDRVQQNLETAKNAISGSVVQTEPAAYSADVQKNSADLMAQAAEYRKMGQEEEAKELEGMAKQSSEWAKEEVEPGAAGRRKDDKNQQVFEDLISRSRFESMRAMINEGRGDEMAAKANRTLFKQAQSESGQKPTMEAGAAGRGRPKKDPASRIYIKSEAPGAQQPMFSDPAVYLGTKGASESVPSEERKLAPEQAPRLPTGVEIEGAARKWVNDELGKAIEQEGKKGTALPDVEDFEKYMARNYHVQPGQARQFYQDALMNRLESASGEQLQSLLKASFGPESILGRMRIPDASGKAAPEEKQSVMPFGALDLKEKTSEQKELDKERAPGRRELNVAEATQQRRQKAIALVFNKALGVTTAEDPSLLARKNILPSEIRTGVKFGEGGVQPLGREDENDPELEDKLYNDSRRSNRDKASITRRILVVRKKSDNSVHQVSVWRNPATKRMFITNPDLPQGEGLGLKDALKRYGLIETYSLDHPVEKFHKRFKSVKEYADQFGKEAGELSGAAADYNPQSVSEGDFARSTAPTVTGEDESGNIGPVHPTEGINEGGSGSFMGPDKGEIASVLESGSDFIAKTFGKITDNEARAIARAFGEAETVEDAKKILKGLGADEYAKSKGKWKAAATRVQKAQESVSRAEAERTTAPEEHQTEKGSPEVEAARKRLRAALYDAARATADLNQEASLRSGIAKIARRYERLYGTRETSEFNEKGEQFKNREKVPTEDLFHSMAKSVFAASLKGVLRPDPLSGIKSLGGDKAEASPWDRPQTPTGRELTMLDRRSPASVKPENLPPDYQAPEKVPPPADAMTPAPRKPIETLDGKDFHQIEQSTMTPERRREIAQNIVKFTPEEQAEIAKAQVMADYQRKRAARAAAKAGPAKVEPPRENLQLESERAPDLESTIPEGIPKPSQQRLSFGAAGRKYDHETPADRADYLGMVGLSWLERGPLKQWVAAGFDAYHTMARNFARRKGNGVRLLSYVKGKENKDMLGSAISMHATSPFEKNYVWDQDALNEYSSAERDNPDVQLAQTLLTETPHNIKLHLQREIEKNPNGERASYFKSLIGEVNQFTGKDKPVRNEKGQTVGWREPEENALGMVRLKGARMLKEAQRKIENDLLKRGWITHAGATYKWDDTRKYKLDDFLQLLDIGTRKAMGIIQNGQRWEKRAASKWLADIAEHRKNVEYAKANWSDTQLQQVTERAARELDAQYDRENANGAALDYNDAYLPGRYDGEVYNNFSVTFAPQIAGRRYTRGKAYANYYEAAASDMNIAATHDISNLVEHRVRQGMVNLGKDNWHHDITNLEDPTTGKRAYALAKQGKGGRWVPDLKAGESERDYEAVSADATRRPVFALRGSFERLMSQLVTPSAIQKSSLGQLALKANQTLKHVALVGDIFHLGRLSWYSGAINRAKGLNLWRGANHVPGWAALEFDAKDLPAAKQAGILDDGDIKWLADKIQFRENGVNSTMARLGAARELEKVGFNVGQIGDAIYKDLVTHVPVLGTYNNWLFDKFTRGIMTKTALQEFERIQKLEPDTDSNVVMRRVAHDLNRVFGSIGKQGWIKSNTFQDLSRIIFLAPQWMEGLIAKDMAIPYKAITSWSEGPRGFKNLMTGHETIARGMAQGLLGMFVLTQVVNMITRKQPTWQNEEGHKWDADIGDNVWVNPLSVFNEITHEFIRYAQSKEKFWDAARQIGENKLGFLGRAALVAATDTSPTGQYLSTDKAVAKGVAQQLLPVPVTAGPVWQGVGSALTSGKIDPPRAADLRRSGAAAFGIKAEVGQTQESMLYGMAQKFVKANKLSSDPEHHEQTDEPSYSKLRSELKLGNEAGAKQILEGLRKAGKSERQIIEGMSRWVTSSFTGSRRNEVLWLRSLTPEELGVYRQAVVARRDLYRKWLSFYTSDRNANTRP